MLPWLTAHAFITQPLYSVLCSRNGLFTRVSSTLSIESIGSAQYMFVKSISCLTGKPQHNTVK